MCPVFWNVYSYFKIGHTSFFARKRNAGGSNANEISDFCRQTHEPVYIMRNGTGDMVVVSIEEYERQQALIDLYGKLAVAEQEITAGAQGEDFLAIAHQMRERVHGKL